MTDCLLCHATGKTPDGRVCPCCDGAGEFDWEAWAAEHRKNDTQREYSAVRRYLLRTAENYEAFHFLCVQYGVWPIQRRRCKILRAELEAEGVNVPEWEPIEDGPALTHTTLRRSLLETAGSYVEYCESCKAAGVVPLVQQTCYDYRGKAKREGKTVPTWFSRRKK